MNQKIYLLFYKIAFLFAIGMILYWIKYTNIYQSGDDFGYYVGVTGASMMLLLLLYSLKKRTKIIKFGKMSKWLNIHMLLGLLGPFLILIHSKMTLGAMNSKVAFFSMLAIVASGVIGRFIFKKTNFILADKVKQQKSLKLDILKDIDQDKQLVNIFQAIEQKIKEQHMIHNRLIYWKFYFFSLTYLEEKNLIQKISQFILNIGHHMMPQNKDTTVLTNDLLQVQSQHPHYHQMIIAHMIDYISSEIQLKEYKIWQKIFSWWHILHIPFLFLLILTTLFHIYAVHAY